MDGTHFMATQRVISFIYSDPLHHAWATVLTDALLRHVLLVHGHVAAKNILARSQHTIESEKPLHMGRHMNDQHCDGSSNSSGGGIDKQTSAAERLAGNVPITIELDALERGDGDDARRPRSIGEQRNLSKVIRRAKGSDLLRSFAVLLHLHHSSLSLYT